VVAVVANLAVAVAKGIAAILTGSAALTAETTHSVADTCNEVLLYLGVRRSGRPPDERHPFGYGQVRYFWSLLAAVGIFTIGGLFAIYDGVRTLQHPNKVTDVSIGIAVLLLSAIFEAISWRTAHKQVSQEAKVRHLDLSRHIASAADPAGTTVFLEDSAALIGIALALIALVLDLVTGSPIPDGVASLLIGLLLIAVAVLLMRRNGALLIDESAPPDVLDRLREQVRKESWVRDVADLTAVRIGPNHLLLHVHVVPVDDDRLVQRIAGLRHRLLDVDGVQSVEVTPVDRRG
jgi:cation diffusion facilitator family transporter